MTTPNRPDHPSEENVELPAAPPEVSRVQFLKMFGATIAAAAAWAVRMPGVARAQSTAPGTPTVPAAPELFPEGNPHERMRAELHRALQKPVEKRRWGMVIDLRKCIGCKACTVSCVAENNLPPGVVYRPVIEEEVGIFPNVRKNFLPRPCMQCDEPPCVKVCPVSATYKRPDGVVEINYDHCIGCRYCVTACPYGARQFDFGEFFEDGTPEIMDYETRPNYEYGQARERRPEDRQTSPMGNARKCHFCLHRLAVGLLPACVTTCVGGATYFGDLNDPDSLVNEILTSASVMRLKEELGTQPKVYYLR